MKCAWCGPPPGEGLSLELLEAMLEGSVALVEPPALLAVEATESGIKVTWRPPRILAILRGIRP